MSTGIIPQYKQPSYGISTVLKPKALITIAEPMIARRHNSDDLPSNLSTQKIIFK